MKLQHIIGTDLSKESIDLSSHELQTHLRIENSFNGFRQMLKWLRDQKISCSNVFFWQFVNLRIHGAEFVQTCLPGKGSHRIYTI